MKYKGQKITLKKIKSFLEGNFKFILDEFDLLPLYYQEQVVWRASLCKDDCLKEGACKYCGCNANKKIYVESSCNNGERFPDLMSEKDWKKFKEDNDIEIYV